VNFPALQPRLASVASDYRLARSLAIRGLGLVYLVAIASWWSQATLLVGEKGLAPASRLLEWLGPRMSEEGQSAFLALPGLFWITGASDLALNLTCPVGCALALLVVAGRLVGPAVAGLAVVYLSQVNTGGVFISFQWNILLLEAGWLALFLCPWGWKMGWRKPPPLSPVNRVALVLAWFLVAKLMFLSGWVKLARASEATPEWWPVFKGTARPSRNPRENPGLEPCSVISGRLSPIAHRGADSPFTAPTGHRGGGSIDEQGWKGSDEIDHALNTISPPLTSARIVCPSLNLPSSRSRLSGSRRRCWITRFKGRAP
jgi:hypothetical protein